MADGGERRIGGQTVILDSVKNKDLPRYLPATLVWIEVDAMALIPAQNP